jgi:hypothetical protein
VKVKAAPDKNFRRARSKPARRRRFGAMFSWRVARALLLGVVVVYASYRAFELSFNAAALHQPDPRHGNVRLSSGEVQTIVRDLQRQHLTANLARSRRCASVTPWCQVACAGCCHRRSTFTFQSGGRSGSAASVTSCI